MTAHPDLRALWQAGVDAVSGETSVARALRVRPVPRPDLILAVGKAATAMARAACAEFPETPTLIVTKHGHAAGAPVQAQVIEAGHPVPDEASLRAGRALLDRVRACGGGSAHLLMLVSGGASALAEYPVDDMGLDALAARTRALLGSGADIATMNTVRRGLSRIKGGKLLAAFAGARVTTLAISDVEGDSLAVIGSGLGNAPDAPRFAFDARIVASNAIARQAVVAAGQAQGLHVARTAETLYDDITALAPRIAADLITGGPGLTVLGGEPTVILPDRPGRGGRNQALALLLAREIAGRSDLRILVAGTDGSDGPTDAAGAIVDGGTWDTSGDAALAAADAGTWLDARGALLRSGPTGTNVMDLLIAYRGG